MPAKRLLDMIRDAGNGSRCHHVLVYGAEGIGKSVFAMKSLFNLLRPSFSSDDETWEKVLELTIFDMKELVKTLRWYMQADQYAPAIISDDSGIHLSGLRYSMGFADRYYMMMYEALADTARTATGAIFYTSPSPRRLTKNIRERPGSFHVKIISAGGGDFQRMGKVYEIYWDEYRNTARKRRTETITFNARLPDWVFQQYMVDRKANAYKILTELDLALANKEKTKADEFDEMRAEIERVLALKKNEPEGDEVVPAMGEDGAPEPALEIGGGEDEARNSRRNKGPKKSSSI